MRRVSLFKPVASPVTLIITLESLELKGKTATVKPPSQVFVELDIPGDEGELTKSTKATVKLAAAKVGYQAKYDVQPGSSVRKALVDALQTETEEDSEVILTLLGLADGKTKDDDAKVLGEAKIKLERLLVTKSDLKSAPVTFFDDSKTPVAELKVSTTCLAAMQTIDREVKENLAGAAHEAAKKKKEGTTAATLPPPRPAPCAARGAVLPSARCAKARRPPHRHRFDGPVPLLAPPVTSRVRARGSARRRGHRPRSSRDGGEAAARLCTGDR